MFCSVDGRISPRLQGDIGERAAAVWLLSRPRTSVFIPFGHSPDADLVADIDGCLVRVQVKTTALYVKNGRYQVSLATRGGNQSWNRIVKRFSSSRCEYLSVLGRRSAVVHPVIGCRRQHRHHRRGTEVRCV